MTKPARSNLSQSRQPATVWVVVADAGRARVLESVTPAGVFTEFEDRLNPAARLQEHDVVSDRKGRVTQGAAGIGQSFEPRQTQASHEADSFAKSLCERLEAARQQGNFGSLYLVAEPSFLGLMRKHLTPATRSMVRKELASDLTRMSAAVIRDYLPEHL